MGHKLHGDVRDIILNPGLMHRHYIRVVKAGCRTGFSLEGFCICRVRGCQTVRLLYGYFTPQACVHCAEDRTLASLAKLLEDLVVPEHLSHRTT